MATRPVHEEIEPMAKKANAQAGRPLTKAVKACGQEDCVGRTRKAAKRAAKKKPALAVGLRRRRPEARVLLWRRQGDERNRSMRDMLGGKGANLAEMTSAGLPVPAGFTISTDVCSIYYKEGGKIPASIDAEIRQNVQSWRTPLA